MSEYVLATIVAVGGLICLCGCICAAGVCAHASNTQFSVTYTRNPVAVAQVSGSPVPEADEDPTDFNSNPKSSSVSVGS